MKRGKWGRYENKKLEKLYTDPNMEMDVIMIELDRSRSSITARAHRSNIRRPPKLYREVIRNRLVSIQDR